MRLTTLCAAAVVALPFVSCDAQGGEDAGVGTQTSRGWLSWRGPQQNGTSLEDGLPSRVSIEAPGSWTYELAGRGTPVIADGRVYTLGYEGEADQLQEVLVCLDASTGKKVWEHRYTEFLTDIIYYRFSIGSPTIDPATGNVYHLATAGLLTCFTREGGLVWQHSMMGEYGRLSFPNGRTGAPLIDGNLCIVHVPTSGWASYGPARDRFFAFEKDTGVSVWSCTPGGPPKDASFSFPVVADSGSKRVLYAGLAGGHVVCVDVRTGDPLWKFQLAIGGLSSSPVLYGDRVIATSGKENLDTSTAGRMIALARGADAGKLGKKQEAWRNDIVAFTSSPVIVGNRIYSTGHTGELFCVDADTGKKLWHEKLAPDQIHASPAHGDGKLYVPMNNGSFHIVRPSDTGPELLQRMQLEGNCLGAPAICDGRIYVHTTKRLYCFAGGQSKAPSHRATAVGGVPGQATRLQVIPADICVATGETIRFRVRSLDANGLVVSESVDGAVWTGVPKTGVEHNGNVMSFGADAATTAVMAVSAGGLEGSVRLRVVPAVPFTDDFEQAKAVPHPRRKGAMFYPPRSYWVGAGLKWEILEREGKKVLAKTLTPPLFQRTMSLIGDPASSNYTVTVDILSEGNRRTMSTGGVVNQRFLIRLKGNAQMLEVSSNEELFKKGVEFAWRPGVWYRLKTRVDVEQDGSGWVRAKAWPRDGKEPDAWTLEGSHPHIHRNGAPGIYGFVPQSRFHVYLDNISVTPNE